jgi:hypothetical protein
MRRKILCISLEAERPDLETHRLLETPCLPCLAVVLCLLHRVSEEEEKALALLYPIGLKAAEDARNRCIDESAKYGMHFDFYL